MYELVQLDLEKWGLPAQEAHAYLALIRSGPLGASGIASAIGMARTSVYPILESLLQKGLVEAGAGLGSRYTAVAPKEALRSLMVHEREELVQRDRLTGNLIKQLEALAQPADSSGEAELVQVLKDPRVIAERFLRLELEAEQQVEVFCKPPVFIREGNPAQEDAMRRGVRVRGLYERACLDVEIVRSNLAKWLRGGEEARAYDGELPHKLAVFDRYNVLMPLITPGGQSRTLFVKSPQLGASLGLLFDFLWEQSQPLSAEAPDTIRRRRQNSVPRQKDEKSTVGRRNNHDA